MDEALEKNLRSKIDVGQTMRGFMNHPGFKIWNEHLQGKIDDVKKEWLTSPDPLQAERIRTRAIQLNEALDIIKRKVIEGDNAAKMLASAQEEDNLNRAPYDGQA
jgi:hypothetical protein